ncbi:MAG: hypothetical protein JXR56_01240 [Candidatus Cloacimonetes bacterium]|nr:hypothetical protein [Candidatus Cloacimonadota bacterium]
MADVRYPDKLWFQNGFNIEIDLKGLDLYKDLHIHFFLPSNNLDNMHLNIHFKALLSMFKYY